MIFAFDLDGTLDRPEVADLARLLLRTGHEVHIITGVFLEAGDWQCDAAKHEKLKRIGGLDDAKVHVLWAMPETYPRDYRLADLGLRKGALCEKLGVRMLFDDNETYCEMAKKMHGGLAVMKVS